MWMPLGELLVASSHSFSLQEGREFFLSSMNTWDVIIAMAQYSEDWALPLDCSCLYCSKSDTHGIIQTSSHCLFPIGSWSRIFNICNLSVGVQHCSLSHILLLCVMPFFFLHNYLNTFYTESLSFLPSLIPCLIAKLYVQNLMQSKKLDCIFQFPLVKLCHLFLPSLSSSL